MSEFSIGKIIEFTSDAFPRVPEDEDCVNPEIRGYALSAYLCAELNAYGYNADIMHGEDWGFASSILGTAVDLGFGCSGEDDRFVVQIIPSTPYVRKWFRKVDISADVTKLAITLFEIIEKSGKAKSGPEWF